jgi:uncharacterized protein (DUF1810 family)
MEAADPFDLGRFLTAQAPVFASAVDELNAGRKRSHWMWFIFPQLRGLGSSSIAQFYGIGSLAEARAYLAHPVLGPRPVLCTETVLAVRDKSLHEIFGSPDDMKFRSSMTLFASIWHAAQIQALSVSPSAAKSLPVMLRTTSQITRWRHARRQPGQDVAPARSRTQEIGTEPSSRHPRAARG